MIIKKNGLKIGIPYMGGKRQLSKQIADFILKENPNCKYIYDLFGGGGAISFEFMQRPQIKQVFYNEFDPALPALLNKIRTDGITDEFYQWVSREDFIKLKEGKDWRAGLIKTCWSFGNNGRGYLFGRDIEEPKRLLHEIIVNKCEKSRELFPLKFDDSCLIHESINERRLAVMAVVKKTKRFDLEQLQRLQQLEQLERLQQLEQLERLQLINKSYEDVEITTPIDETVIYLDPPYFNTSTYQNKISHDLLYYYIDNSPYKIYLSSYEAPYISVLEMKHRSTLSSTNNAKRTVEKLFSPA